MQNPRGGIVPVYAATCPNCGGAIEADRLEKGLVCRHCLNDDEVAEIAAITNYHERVEALGKKLAERGKLHGYSYLYTSVLELKEFSEFFAKATGSNLWSAQLTWAKRLLQGESMAIVAPTGVGKTTLLSVYAVYRASEGAKVYYLLPTENLARQVVDKLAQIARAAGIEARMAAYYSSMSRRVREESLKRIEDGDYDILVTTTSFLSRRWGLLEGKRFDVVIVDDVDAVLRNSKNVDRILLLLGFDEEAVATAYTLVKKKIMSVVAKVSGQHNKYMKLLEEIKEAEALLSKKIVEAAPGQLIIASATGRAYGIRPKIFRELLGFEIGRVHDFTRSIVNFYKVTERLLGEAVKVVEELGPGGLVFVSKRLGREVAKQLVEELRKRGIRAGLALSGRRVLERFAEGELDVLVGVASYYGVIVRGVDLPQRVLYTVFVGIPGNEVDAEKALSSPYRIARLAIELSLPDADELVKSVSRLSPGEQTALRIALSNGERLEGRLGEILEKLLHTRGRVLRELHRRLCPRGSLVAGGTLYRCRGSKLVAITADAATYVQASGRASRMYGGGMTHGISIVLEEDPLLVELLVSRLQRFLDKPEFKPYSSEEVARELEEARRSRLPGGAKKVDIETSLIIVESPTKARTIASFFGRPVRRRLGSVPVYETTFYNEVSGKIHVAVIAASVGHIYDLSLDDEGLYGVEIDGADVKPIYKHIKRCLECGHQFSSSKNVCPRCGSSNVASKEDVINALRQLAAENEVVYIATDPDIEGEKIAYDLYTVLAPYARMVKRIELHEITRRELMRALANPRSIDKRMVEAQIVRRIEDRWIGFGLSQHLWQVFGKRWLGAGRVQTPVLGWIIERYNEWKATRGFNVYVKLADKLVLKLHADTRGVAEEWARRLLEEGVKVTGVELSTEQVSPPPPFTTESLIYEASRRYGYPAYKTMRVAQELFEAGLITYHRTDSTHVSPTGMGVAKKYLEEKGLLEYYAPKQWGPQGHHEAIRPTRPIDAETLRRMVAVGDLKLPIAMREPHYRIYDLIFRRFIASQMKPAKLVKVTLSVVMPWGDVRGITYYAGAIESSFVPILRRPAFISLKPRPGATLIPERVVARRGSEVQLYTHGEVVALMKEKGIGRPSTYAKTIESIVRHGYVVESRYRKKLVPTKLGIEVYDYLSLNYGDLVSEERTKKLLAEIEAITRGELGAREVIAELYQELEELLPPPRVYSIGEALA